MTNQLSTLRNKYEQAQKLTKKNIHEFMTTDLTEALIKAFCAFGKSAIEVWTILEYTQKTSLLLLSSLNLLDQFRTEYFDDNKIDNDQFEIFFVCSDRNATTDEKEIKDFLNNNSGKKKLIVCLYQSFHVLTKVIKKTVGISNIDFVIADESHNLTCNKHSTDGKKLAKTIKNYDDVKKLYFSATPSKEQEEHMIFKYTYLDGVKDGIMQPFDIYLQVALSEEDPQDDNKDENESDVAIKIFRSMVRNFIETGNNKLMSFHNGVQEINKKSILPVKSFLKYQSLYQEVFEDILEKEYPEKKKDLSFSFHIDGLHGEVPEKERREILNRFDREYNDPNCLYILSSCMTLREGVNTKTANALIWVDPRYTKTMIIQNLGRIIRKHDKTQNGSVIIPIFVDRQLYNQCQTQEERNEFLQDQLQGFNPAVSFLHALKEEDPLIVQCLEFYASTTTSCSNDNNNNNKTITSNDTTTTTRCLPQQRQDVPFKLRIHLNFDKNDFGYNLHLENTIGESMISKLCHTINYDAIAEKVDKLIEFTNLNERAPSQKDTYKECNVGSLWHIMKHGCNARFLQRCLDKSTFLKKDYENLLKKREEKKLKPQYTIEQKIELLIECTNLSERVPYAKETYKECTVGKVWHHIKNGNYAPFVQHCLNKSRFLKDDFGKSPQDKWKQSCYEAVDYMYLNQKRPSDKSQDPVIKHKGSWICDQITALNVFLNDKYNPNNKTMRHKAALMKDLTIREIWSQIKQFMDNKQWDEMKSYVNQLKEEDNNINNKETDNDNDSVDVEDTYKKEDKDEKDEADLSSITCSEYEDEDDSCTTSESTSNSLRSKHNRTEEQKRTTTSTTRRGPKPRKNGYTISDVLERRPSYFYLLKYGKTQLYKGGRSNCVKTRLKQINNASIRAHAKMFPETHYVYECIYEQRFDSEDEAHAFEQSFFKNLEKHTNNVDGEYYCIPSDLLTKISHEHNIQLETSH